ncbi:division/cell wall cluster transcriptional repressor MraZ [Candidatus Latescibacterota bacterium]
MTMLKSAGLTGQSDNKVDSKGRINIPAAFRKILVPDEYDEVVVTLGPNRQLLLFNKEYWDTTIQQEIIDSSRIIGKENVWRAIHRVSENSHMSTADNQGRITIPGWLLKKAGIENNVIVIGAFDRVSVWAPKEYKEWISEVDIDSVIADLGLF